MRTKNRIVFLSLVFLIFKCCSMPESIFCAYSTIQCSLLFVQKPCVQYVTYDELIEFDQKIMYQLPYIKKHGLNNNEQADIIIGIPYYKDTETLIPCLVNKICG